MESEAVLLETLQNWNLIKNDIIRKEEELREKEYKVTTSYSEAKSFSSGTTVSKVETYCFSIMENKAEIEKLKRRLKLCSWAYRNTDLTEHERLTIVYTRKGKSLLQLSKNLDIAQARIYRIRDKAISKMYAKIRNEAKN